MRALCFFAALAALVTAAPAVQAQQTVQAVTVTSCGTPPNTPVVGNPYVITMDTSGKLCVAASVNASSAPYQYTSTGYVRYATLGAVTPVSLATAFGGSVPANSKYCFISVETGAARYRADSSGASVTASAGNPINTGSVVLFSYPSWTNLYFISQSGTITLNADCYQ